MLSAAFHLNQLDAGNALKDGARFVEDVVLDAQVAGIVIGDALVNLALELNFPICDQTGNVLCVMFCIEIEVGIVIAENVKAMRRCRNDLLGLGLI